MSVGLLVLLAMYTCRAGAEVYIMENLPPDPTPGCPFTFTSTGTTVMDTLTWTNGTNTISVFEYLCNGQAYLYETVRDCLLYVMDTLMWTNGTILLWNGQTYLYETVRNCLDVIRALIEKHGYFNTMFACANVLWTIFMISSNNALVYEITECILWTKSCIIEVDNYVTTILLCINYVTINCISSLLYAISRLIQYVRGVAHKCKINMTNLLLYVMWCLSKFNFIVRLKGRYLSWSTKNSSLELLITEGLIVLRLLYLYFYGGSCEQYICTLALAIPVHYVKKLESACRSRLSRIPACWPVCSHSNSILAYPVRDHEPAKIEASTRSIKTNERGSSNSLVSYYVQDSYLPRMCSCKDSDSDNSKSNTKQHSTENQEPENPSVPHANIRSSTTGSATSQGNGRDDDEDDDRKHPGKRDLPKNLDLMLDDQFEDEDELDETYHSILKSSPMLTSDLSPISSIRPMSTCIPVKGINDTHLTYRNITVPGYVSVSQEGNSRDVVIEKLFLPEEACDLLLVGTLDNVSLKTNEQTGRSISIFCPTHHTVPKHIDVYHNRDFGELPIMIDMMNSLLNDHLLDSNLSINACIIEKISHNPKIPDTCLIPSELKDVVSDCSPMTILCLGPQSPIDIIPKSLPHSTHGKRDVGRLFPVNGSAIFLSASVVKGNQIRSESVHLNYPSAFNPASDPDSIRMIFFQAKTDCTPLQNHLAESLPPINNMCIRMAQEPAYEEAVRDKCSDITLDTILTLYDQQTSANDSREDKVTRILTLLSSPNLTPDIDIIASILKKMRIATIRKELTRLNLSPVGGVVDCKVRLTEFLANKTDEDDHEKDDSEFSHSPEQQSPTDFNFKMSASLPMASDFLKTHKGPVVKKAKRKRHTAGESTNTEFKGIQDYLNGLESATNPELTCELEFLHLDTDGSAKAKRKRISQHFSKSMIRLQLPDPNLTDNRMSLIENSQLSISSKLDDLMRDVNNLSFSIPSSQTGITAKSPEGAHSCNLDRPLVDKLTKSTEQLSSLLELSEKSIIDLQSSIKQTSSLKRELETWSESVFKNDDSDRLKDIHSILTAKSDEENNINRKVRASPSESPRYKARLSSKTKTNPDIPGYGTYQSQSPERPRLTYRRLPTELNRSTRSKNKNPVPPTRKPHRVVLVTDSLMSGFDARYFSNQFSVKTVKKRSIQDLRHNLSASVQEISQYAPEVVYIHLGTKDIQESRRSADILNDLECITEEILKETSQACQVIISQVISCTDKSIEVANLRKSVSKLIQSYGCTPEKDTFWKRVSINSNNNFFTRGGDKLERYLFAKDMIHFSERGIRAIMGNLRTSLKSHCEIKNHEVTSSES